jgi:hypothetical protein
VEAEKEKVEGGDAKAWSGRTATTGSWQGGGYVSAADEEVRQKS